MHRVIDFLFQRLQVLVLAAQGARGDADFGEDGEHFGETAIRADIS